ncbi:MAG: aminoacyl-tRNA hydrolase [Clostridia bacterium]|nr:aminoacyl-tRNA hydrolase [Clostridia bacterium]
MEKQTYIVVGLGNPGAQYARTRHNAGFETLEALSRRWNVDINRKKFNGLIAETTYNGHRVVLCLPQTFMNASGECVQELLQWYKCPLENMIVIYDDIDLPLSRLRVRKSGSAGTHNGMRSILGCIGNQQGFPRIRVGVGAKPEGWDLADWVLSTYRLREEREEMEKAFARAADCVEDWLKNGIEHAMQQYNGK